MTRRVLIAGCGYVGSALARRLTEAEVWTLRRRPQHLDPTLGPGIHTLAADLLDAPQLATTLRDIPPLDTVFYTAAADGRSDAAYRDAYVVGLETLLRVLTDLGQRPRRLLYTSSTSVYAQQGGEWVDEDSPTEPTHCTGRRLLEGEALASSGPVPATVVRFGGIYGPGRGRLVDQVRRGEARCPATVPGEAPLYSNRIHRDDCAGVLHHLMELESPDPLYLGVDDDPAELCTVLCFLARRLGAPAVPREESADPRDRRRRSNKRCRSARLKASGYRFQYPSFREGYGALLADSME